MGQSPTVEVGTTGFRRETGHVDGGRAAKGCRGSAPGGAARHLGPAATGAHVGPKRLEGRPEVDHATRLQIVGHAEIQLAQPALRPRNGLYLAFKLFVGIIRIMLIHYISWRNYMPMETVHQSRGYDGISTPKQSSALYHTYQLQNGNTYKKRLLCKSTKNI